MKSINEILGTVTTQNPPAVPNVLAPAGFTTPAQGGPSNYRGFSEVQPFCQKMRPFQSDIYNRLVGGQDLYITASPGGGKTLPYVCYWLDTVLILNTSLKYESNDWNDYRDQIYNLFVQSGFAVAFTEINRPALTRLERHLGVFSALCAYCRKHLPLPETITAAIALCLPCLTAWLTPLRLVGIAFGLKEFLFLCGKGKVYPAIGTLECLVFKTQCMTSSLKIVGSPRSSIA